MRMTRRLALLGAACLVGASATARLAQVTPQQSDLVAALVARFLTLRPAPAVSVAVWDGPGPIWTRAWGKADVENDVPATPKALFRLASISKPFTARSCGGWGVPRGASSVRASRPCDLAAS